MSAIHARSPTLTSADTVPATTRDHDADEATSPNITTPTRPRLTSRKSSGTIIVPREHPHVELRMGDEVFDEDDARAMSPRRSTRDLEQMSADAREQLRQYEYHAPPAQVEAIR